MAQAVAQLEYTRGETVIFGLRATPAYDGTETVACDIKPARNGSTPPSDDTAVAATPSIAFVAAAGDVAAHWLFTLTAEQSAAIPAGRYITDARVLTGGTVDYVDPIVIVFGGRVTVR